MSLLPAFLEVAEMSFASRAKGTGGRSRFVYKGKGERRHFP
jgi:hypothetical protein